MGNISSADKQLDIFNCIKFEARNFILSEVIEMVPYYKTRSRHPDQVHCRRNLSWDG